MEGARGNMLGGFTMTRAAFGMTRPWIFKGCLAEGLGTSLLVQVYMPGPSREIPMQHRTIRAFRFNDSAYPVSVVFSLLRGPIEAWPTAVAMADALAVADVPFHYFGEKR